jgi:hypothetical protein
MKDYRECIHRALEDYPGIRDSTTSVDHINDALNRTSEVKGGSRLVKAFCRQDDDPEQARDHLLEIIVCVKLLDNPDVRDLDYEPKTGSRPPDFRFSVDKVHFDLEVKRLNSTCGEYWTQSFVRQFRKRLEKELGPIQKPWRFHWWASLEIRSRVGARSREDDFLQYLRENIDSFSPSLDPIELGGGPRRCKYRWPLGDGHPLAGFSFEEKNSGGLGIEVEWMMPGYRGVNKDDREMIRRAVRNKLDDALRKFEYSECVSAKQSNLVLIQPGDDVCTLGFPTLNDRYLYGEKQEDGPDSLRTRRMENGLLRPDQFTNISGVVMVFGGLQLLSDPFAGMLYPHPLHRAVVEQQPIPLPGMLIFHGCEEDCK